MENKTKIIFQKKPMLTFEYMPNGVSIKRGASTNSELHNHKDIEFKYILNNSGTTVVIGNNKYTAKKGDFITANSTVPHGYFTKKPFDYATIIFASELWLSFGIDITSIKFTEFVRDSEIDAIMKIIVDEHYSKRPFYKFRVNNHISDLVICMLRKHTQNDLRLIENISQSQLDIANTINEYLAQNYNRKITIDELADNLGFNKSYMMRTYKKVTSMTILEKLYTIRCNHATEELDKQKRLITDIAYITGFESPSHFGKIYKSFTGMSPSEYRKK